MASTMACSSAASLTLSATKGSLAAVPSALRNVRIKPATRFAGLERPSSRAHWRRSGRVSPETIPPLGLGAKVTTDNGEFPAQFREPAIRLAWSEHIRNRPDFKGFCFVKNKTLSMPQGFLAIMSNRNQKQRQKQRRNRFPSAHVCKAKCAISGVCSRSGCMGLRSQL